MKIIFFGTPLFAANNLQYLIDNKYDIIATVTPPDSKKGRGKQLRACAVKETALRNNIPTLQPEKLRSEEFINTLTNLNADIFVVVAFRMLPEVVWSIPAKGTINLHASLLPNYKGAAPINRVLINGEKETGISTFFINHKIDSGKIIKQQKIKLNNKMTAAELHNIMINKGNKLLKKTLLAIKENYASQTTQKNNKEYIEAPKLTKELLKIDWTKSANEIHNLVRGLSPLDGNTILKDITICPSAWFLLEKTNKKRIKLHKTEVIKSNTQNEIEIKTDNKSYLHIVTRKDSLAILHLQVEGKKPMKIKQFLQGNKISKDHKVR